MRRNGGQAERPGVHQTPFSPEAAGDRRVALRVAGFLFRPVFGPTQRGRITGEIFRIETDLGFRERFHRVRQAGADGVMQGSRAGVKSAAAGVRIDAEFDQRGDVPGVRSGDRFPEKGSEGFGVVHRESSFEKGGPPANVSSRGRPMLLFRRSGRFALEQRFFLL
jgi:hypothetical protein